MDACIYVDQNLLVYYASFPGLRRHLVALGTNTITNADALEDALKGSDGPVGIYYAGVRPAVTTYPENVAWLVGKIRASLDAGQVVTAVF